jgi:hypothetical protein
VTAAVELGPVHDLVALLGIATDRDVLGENGYAGGNAGRLNQVLVS